MTTVINAHPRQETRQEPGGQTFGCLVAAGLIAFGLWMGANKTLEFAHGRLRDAEAIQAAEMQMLMESMNCLPGETLVIIPLPGSNGAKAVRCVPGDNMPRRQLEGGTRG